MGPTSMPMIQLSSGHSMPQIGLGTWKSSPVAVRGSVLEAIRCGYRHIDCAAKYENEHEVGQALEEALQAGEVERSALFVASKLWNDMHASADVERACRQSLADLRLDYLDLYLIHWPVADGSPPPSTEETWRAMEGLVDAGLVRSIGVSNFSAPKLRDVCELARIAPVVNQVELHPLWRQARARPAPRRVRSPTPGRVANAPCAPPSIPPAAARRTRCWPLRPSWACI
jgi:alcohol dehydrogenase (NADP+)